MLNFYYKDSIQSFLQKSPEEIIGSITTSNYFDSTLNQNRAWRDQIEILKSALYNQNGEIFFEFAIPRMGKRVDVVLLIDHVVFVIEFKIGETRFNSFQIDQVWDYALDLKNFHKPSHTAAVVPILVSTEAKHSFIEIETTSHNDNLLLPLKTNKEDLANTIRAALAFFAGKTSSDLSDYEKGKYAPTPTIIEAAISLYNSHSVDEIIRNDAEAINLTKTTTYLSRVIKTAKELNQKVICFVTGVPGAGKTLVGLKIATTHLDETNNNASVYLSGNFPLVSILQEALARDKVKREAEKNIKLRKGEAKQAVKTFIQIIHHYRDQYLNDPDAPFDHVAIFDEAQRIWNREQTIKFMKQKKGKHDFDSSETEFLISCLDRHKDWAVIICLVGGGQEINTGEAGISEWLNAVNEKFSHWQVNISPNLVDSEYAVTDVIEKLKSNVEVKFNDDLHLAVSMRSFRAENLSLMVKNILDLKPKDAQFTYSHIAENYPIVITRNLSNAKRWLKEKARGSERYGLIVSSQAQRLKPYAIDVKSPIDPVNWFLNEKDDVRSSYYLEDVATEFQVQGLELDWACVTWDGDLRYAESEWRTFGFKGSKWQKINHPERKKYLVNAYRVLLTRARQGMVIVVPEGSHEDHTRAPEFYDPTFQYLQSIGFPVL